MTRIQNMPSGKKAGSLMSSMIRTSFSHNHFVSQLDDDFLIENKKGLFVLKTFIRESIKGSSAEVAKTLDDIIRSNMIEKRLTGFIFLRCETDYGQRRNHGAFLKQSWEVDKHTRRRDFYNVKKLTDTERVVEALFDNGCDRESYKSRIVYFNPKSGIFEAVRFRENSAQHPISNVAGRICDRVCFKGYMSEKEIDPEKCKQMGCTRYAWGREKREVRISELNLPLRMDFYEKDGLVLAEIRGN